MTKKFDLDTISLRPGVTLIEASAGTGKTYSLVGLFLLLLLEEHLPIGDVVAVTYTIAATEELRERVRSGLRDCRAALGQGDESTPLLQRIARLGDRERSLRELDLALINFDDAQIFTIHGFCQRVLHDHAFESGMPFKTEFLREPRALYEEVARDFWRASLYHAEPETVACILAAGHSPARWVELLESTLGHPRLFILPPSTGGTPAAALEKMHPIFLELCQVWAAERTRLFAFLSDSSVIKQDQKKGLPPARLDPFVQALDRAAERKRFDDPETISAVSEFTTARIVELTKKGKISLTHRFFELCSDFTDLVEQSSNALTHVFLNFAATELPARKARTGTLGYDDLVSRVHATVTDPEDAAPLASIRRRYQAALVDEFQDTDPLQFEIFDRIFRKEEHRLFLVGDPKQAIYGFRGADVFTYQQARENAETHTLPINWRSEEGLVEAVNHLFRNTIEPFHFSWLDFPSVAAAPTGERPVFQSGKDGPAPLQFRFLPEQPGDLQLLISRAIARDIIGLIGSGAKIGERAVTFSDLAVLVNYNREALLVQQVLREAGLRSVVQTELSVFTSPEAQELQHLLQAILEPRRESLLRAALATPFFGVGADELLTLETDEDFRQAWLDRFAGWHRLWAGGCFIALFRKLLVEQKVRERLVRLPAGERRLTNFLHLAELLHNAETAERLSPDGLCAWLRAQRQETKTTADEFQLRLESDGDAVQIATIHKSKGLEYPIVFCPFGWRALWFPKDELLFHDLARDNQLTFDLRGTKGGDEQHTEWQKGEKLSEEMRKFYVSITRAQHRCFVYLGAKSGLEDSAIGKLLNYQKKADLMQAADAVARTSRGTIGLSVVELTAPETAPTPAEVAELLPARSFSGGIARVSMSTSFTGVSAGRHSTPEDRPLDEPSPPPAPALAPLRDRPRDTIFDFARGAQAGDFFHKVLEDLRFEDLSDLEEIVARQLTWHGFAATACRDALLEKFAQLAALPLNPNLRLDRTHARDRLLELEFTHRLRALTPDALRATFARCTDLPAGFDARLEEVQFDPVEGYMRGFIDLLVRADGKYYLIDWKSNWLGPAAADYGQEQMGRAMLERNYLLQAYLYALAADLFLQARVPGYRYEEHFGGIYYVFLRGADPRRPGSGIYELRPSRQTMENLRGLVA